ncbi:glycosyltransferase [Stenotrophomonas maltophilia]|uniref:glycosyltransferase n=1 Tax=Stenotrophomonas maltophilia TaxID=40324 RepID=UPI002ACD1141|nr:glycosyltransferase [Stenotrophomonas maltophilia]MDZ5841074.1 glycosyltransferase [Stenotrophomonas maltophilia]
MNARPDVSVIIPTYNEGHKVAKCVEALQAQIFNGTFEVIVVDNGSTHDNPTVPANDPRFSLITEPTPGSYSARNAGLGVASGTLIAFTDSDCVPDPAWLANAWAAFRDSPNISLVAGRIDIFFLDPEKPTSVELFERRFSFRQQESVQQGWAVTANLFVRREVFDRIGGFETKTFSGGDSEFTRRACANGLVMAYEDGAIVQHPARRTLAEINQLRRRHVGGFYRLSKTEQEFAEMFSFKGIAKDFLYPVKGAALVSKDVIARRSSAYDAVRIIGVLTHTRFYRGILKVMYKLNLKKSYER